MRPEKGTEGDDGEARAAGASVGRTSTRSRASYFWPVLIPVLAGWGLGFFLRKIQVTLVPYRVFLIGGSLAGQLGLVPPVLLYAGSQIGVLGLWVAWSSWFHHKARCGWAEALRLDAFSDLPLLALPVVAACLGSQWMQSARCLVDPALLLVIASAGAIKSWHWTRLLDASVARGARPYRFWLWLLFLTSSLTFSTLGLLQFHSWNVAYGDSGAFEQLLWNALHGHIWSAHDTGYTILGGHVMLTQLLLVPLYALWPSLDWLTILQAFAVSACVFPLWWLARGKWGDGKALGFCALFLLQPALHYAVAEVNYNTYRPEVFLIPIVVFGIYFLETKRWLHAAGSGVLLLLSREDMAAIVVAAGLYLALCKKYRVAGTITSAMGAGYFVLCTGVLIPHFSASAVYPQVHVFEGLGQTPLEIALNVLKRPALFLDRLLQVSNFLYACYLLLPLGLLSLGRFGLALVGAPLIVLGMLTTGGVQNSIYFHYHNASFAVLAAAAPEGAATIAAFLAARSRCSLRRAQSVVLCFALSAAAAATLFGSRTPLSLNFYFPRSSPFHYSNLYQRTAHTQLLERVRRRIPSVSRVSASVFAAAHFTHYRGCRVFSDDLGDIDFVFVDLNARWKKGTLQQLQQWGETGPPGFVPVWIEDGLFLFQRKPEKSPEPDTK